MKKQQIKAFTLVELIIVITILAILATIGFISFQSYTLDARDSSRKADLTQLSRGLEIYQTKNSVLPDPDAQTVTIMSGSNTISIQGYAGASVLQKLKSTEMKDSSDNTYYTYIINGDKTKYQLLSMLENNTNLAKINTPLNEAYAINYNSRYPYTKGNKVGIFFSGTTNTPLQETTSGSIDLAGAYSGTTFKVMFANSISNSGAISSTGISLPAQIQTITNSTATTTTIAVNPGIKTTGFSTTLYAGNGTSQPITTGIDMSSQWGTSTNETFGGLVWVKGRSAAHGNYLVDTIRGNNVIIHTESTAIEVPGQEALAPTSTGINVGGNAGVNTNLSTYASWNFQTTHRRTGTTNHGKTFTEHYNPITGFTIIKYEGSGLANHEITHSLGRKLGFYSIKRLTTTAEHWMTGIPELSGYMYWNLTNSVSDVLSNYLTFTNSSVNMVSGHSMQNLASNQYILYGWTNSYYDVSSNLVGNYEIGTYNGTGLSGNKITTRGKPAWLMIKRINNISDWYIHDITRGIFETDGTTKILSANTSAIEALDSTAVLSDGFKIDDTGAALNASGGQYLYMVVYDNDNGSGKSTYMLK